MKKLFLISLGIVFVFLASGCQHKIDIEKEKAELLKMYSLQAQALLGSDVETILSLIPEGHESINLVRGKILKMSKADMRNDFENQFKQGRYVEVTETIAPTITISPDGKMAWVVGQIKYKYAYKDSKGLEHESETADAWLSVYEKRDSKWVEAVSAQTFDKGE